MRPDESEDEVESYEVVGDIIRFMPDDSVTVPLWDATGLLPEDPVWLNRALGLSPELVRDIASASADSTPRPSSSSRDCVPPPGSP